MPMIWLHPAALIALAAVAAPILIHVLVQRRAERMAFPTLRFLRPTALVSIRRHLLEDPVLLAIRVAIVAAAVAAVAGPLVVTRARREAWDRRVVRATVTSAAQPVSSGGAQQSGGLLEARTFRDESLRDGIRRATEWLEQAPPARRELVIAAPLTIGSLSGADIAAIPAAVGVAFERVGVQPDTRTFSYGGVRSADGIVDREVTLAGARTSVRDRPRAAGTPPSAAAAAFPVEVVAPPSARALVDAAMAAVIAERVWLPPAAHRAQVILAADGDASAQAAAGAVQPEPWMAAAISRLTRDDTMRAASTRVDGALDERLSRAPWATVARSSANRPLVAAAAATDRLIVVSAAPPADVFLPIVLRAIVNAIAVVPDVAPLEIVPIPDAQLRRWSRPAAPSPQPRIDAVDSDDRRWLWLAVIGLLVVEMRVRRGRHRGAEAPARETARVA